MKKGFHFISFLFFFIHTKSQTWNLVWSDEFDADSILSKNWTYDIGGSGWGNNELEYYTNRKENARIEKGNLIIEARKESFNGMQFTSARLKTQGLQHWMYGKIEARIKLSAGQGIWPAFWMLGENFPGTPWPKCGEMDIMEHINNDPDIHGTMHWDNNGYVNDGHSTPCNVTSYHIYSIEWNASSIKWFLGGNKYAETIITDSINSTEEFHRPFFIVLNLAVGGNWPGNPDNTAQFPAYMFIDYVRVYQNQIK